MAARLLPVSFYILYKTSINIKKTKQNRFFIFVTFCISLLKSFTSNGLHEIIQIMSRYDIKVSDYNFIKHMIKIRY